jgi:uncharacterized membrane protein
MPPDEIHAEAPIQKDDAPPVASRDGDVKAAEAEHGEGAVVGRTVTIGRPREEVYAFWRDFPNLALIMENIERIDTIDARRSHWVVKGPAGKVVEWDSVVTDDEPGRLMDTKVGTEEKADPADVARDGWEAMKSGKAPIVSGWGNKARAALAHVMPAGMLAEQQSKMAEPGSAE